MNRFVRIRGAVAAAATLAVQTARAAGDSGTSSVGEMQVSGTHLALMVAALVGLGGVVWVLAKVMSR